MTHDSCIVECLEGKPVAEFHSMVEEYFRLALSRRPPTTNRRPLVAFRLEWEFRYVLRPQWRRRSREVDPAIIEVEAFGGTNGMFSSVISLILAPEETRWHRWSYTDGNDAMKVFADLIGHFVRYPQDVFRRSATNCCCCGKRLTDHGSKARGIGPDCMKWFQPWLERRNAKAELVEQRRAEYFEETGFLPGYSI